MNIRSYLGSTFLVAILLLILPVPMFAQELAEAQVAQNLEVADEAASAGDILSITSEDSLVRSPQAYDTNIFGVVVENPAVVFNQESSTTKAVITEGEAQVRVSTVNGDIEVGDFITSSDQAGVGQKATDSGVVLGRALAGFTGPDVGSIPILLNIHHQSLGASDLDALSRLSALASTTLNQPEGLQTILRFLLALIVATLSFILGFVFVAKALRTGLVAIGRNPLARGTLEANMFLNLLGVIILSAAGVGLSLFLIFYG